MRTGCALLKFISPNDAGLTGGHQCGFYLPKNRWSVFTTIEPTKGRNGKSDVEITWDCGLVTQSSLSWYGTGSRSEYRLTRFGRSFQYLDPDFVGSLLVLVIDRKDAFRGYVVSDDDGIEEVQQALGVDARERVAVFSSNDDREGEPIDSCLNRLFQGFADSLSDFPTTESLSREAQHAIVTCMRGATPGTIDEQLQALVSAEYQLFRLVELKLCSAEICRVFQRVDEFLHVALTLLNRRKSRAGRSLENQFGHILREAGIPFTARARDIEGQPDILIPGAAQYNDPTFPAERLCMVGVKTTCRDRWRQVLTEARRAKHRHILTLQPAISANQLREMAEAGLVLVVPKNLHASGYPDALGQGIQLLSVEQFVVRAKALLRFS